MIPTNGHHLHVHIHGSPDAPSVVLLHHGLGNARAWRRQTTALAAAGLRVIAYDRWGYGKSDVRQGLDIPYFEQDQADLLALLDYLSIQRAILVGHSDGGTIALSLAAHYPRRVLGLAAIAAHIYLEPQMLPAIEEARWVFLSDEQFRVKFREAHGEKWQCVFENWYQGWWHLQSLNWDMRPLLASIQCPCFVIQGELDEYTTPQHAREVAAAIPGATLWLAPGVDHMLQRQAPKQLNERLLRFIKDVISYVQ
jgi:pimeloyl-ACP methyl ester carboxylesterase